HREGVTPDQTRSVFEDLFRRLGLDENVLKVDMLFCGPNIAAGLHDTRHSFKHNPSPSKTERSSDTDHEDGEVAVPVPERQQNTSCNASSCPGSSGVSVTFRFNTGLYHDISSLFRAPDVLFLFNAGLWGYDDWVPTLEHVLGWVAVVTSYCEEEADDDMETVERVILQVEWLWKPEVNPHRSLVPRHAACAVEGRVLFENQMWQAIRPSRSSN
ncbi:unnamed protein product, partial [Laminaria digitata]